MSVVFDPSNDMTAWRSMWYDQAAVGLAGRSHLSDAAKLDNSDRHSPDFIMADYFPQWVRPILYPFQWENDFLGHATVDFTRQYWWIGIVMTITYIAAVFGGQKFMKERKAWDMKPLLFAWNFFLAVFSIIGFIRTAPHLLISVFERGVLYTICRCAGAHYGHGPTGFWIFLFIYSKYAELLDTAFLVARKRSVIFLHWYHHATVLLYCWDSYCMEQPSGLWFAAMNYGVHSIMYLYYALAAIGKPPKWGRIVTVLQLSQMFVGMAVTLYHLHAFNTVKNCDGSVQNLTLGFMMYTSYCFLFAQFFVKRYMSSRKGNAEKAKKDLKAE